MKVVIKLLIMCRQSDRDIPKIVLDKNSKLPSLKLSNEVSFTKQLRMLLTSVVHEAAEWVLPSLEKGRFYAEDGGVVLVYRLMGGYSFTKRVSGDFILIDGSELNTRHKLVGAEEIRIITENIN